jgi:hypothetical protein
LLIALFVGLGIDAFYVGPKMPDYPSELNLQKPDCGNYDQLKAMQADYDQKQKAFNEESKTYNRNVSMVSLASAIVVMIISFVFLSKIRMIADGILLGGVFTTAYSIIRGLMSEDSRFRFVIVTAGLIIALVLGYMKFIRPREEQQ